MRTPIFLLVLFLALPGVAQTPEALPFVEADMIQARIYIDKQCAQTLDNECRAVFDGKRLIIEPGPRLMSCLRSLEAKDPSCPRDYAKRGAIKQLDVIKKRAKNIAQGLKIDVVIDGKNFSTTR